MSCVAEEWHRDTMASPRARHLSLEIGLGAFRDLSRDLFRIFLSVSSSFTGSATGSIYWWLSKDSTLSCPLSH